MKWKGLVIKNVILARNFCDCLGQRNMIKCAQVSWDTSCIPLKKLLLLPSLFEINSSIMWNVFIIPLVRMYLWCGAGWCMRGFESSTQSVVLQFAIRVSNMNTQMQLLLASWILEARNSKRKWKADMEDQILTCFIIYQIQPFFVQVVDEIIEF